MLDVTRCFLHGLNLFQIKSYFEVGNRIMTGMCYQTELINFLSLRTKYRCHESLHLGVDTFLCFYWKNSFLHVLFSILYRRCLRDQVFSISWLFRLQGVAMRTNWLCLFDVLGLHYTGPLAIAPSYVTMIQKGDASGRNSF